MGNLFCKQTSTPATSDLSKAIDPTGTYFLQKHLTILVLFGLFTFGQYGKPPSTMLQDNEFEINVLLYKQLFFEKEMKDGPWSHIFLVKFTHLEDLHVFSFEEQEDFFCEIFIQFS